MSKQEAAPLVVGQISGAFGVKGWIKVFDHSRERGDILNYKQWLVGRDNRWSEWRVEAGQRHGKGVVAKLAGCEDRDQALALCGSEIAVWREWLPPADDGEFYWYQLQGLDVVNLGGQPLGTVEGLIETGANDVMVVKGDRERLIPYTSDTVRSVDLNSGKIIVDWEPDF